jgi:TRAP-type transport system periplasmic protein
MKVQTFCEENRYVFKKLQNKPLGGKLMVKRTACFVFAVSFLFASYASADVIKLKFANYFPPTHMNSVMMGKFCDELNKKLAGKVELTQYAGATLLGPDKMSAGVLTGIADMGLSNLSYTRGRFPVMEIMELPLGFPSAWIAGHVANDFYQKYKPKDFDQYHVLMLSTSPINVVQTLNKPVKALEDVKGLRLRGTGRLGDVVKALGGVPVPIGTPDLYDSLKRALIEGAMLPVETMKGFKTGEILKYTTASWKVGSAYCFYVVMNKNKWNSLPRDIQTVISDFSQEFVERWEREWNNIDVEGRDYFLKQGGKILPLADAEAAKWIKAVQPVVDDYKKDLMAKGYKAAEIDGWLSFVKERIEYWKGQEKAKKIPTPYQY